MTVVNNRLEPTCNLPVQHWSLRSDRRRVTNRTSERWECTNAGMTRHKRARLSCHFTRHQSGTEFCRVVTFSSAYQTCASESRPACWSTDCLFGTKRVCRGRIQPIYRPFKVASNFKASHFVHYASHPENSPLDNWCGILHRLRIKTLDRIHFTSTLHQFRNIELHRRVQDDPAIDKFDVRYIARRPQPQRLLLDHRV